MTAVVTPSADGSLPLSAVSAPAQIGPFPRRTETPLELENPSAARSRYLSPLRYPGAKSGLVPVIEGLLTASRPSIGQISLLVEPFAGGASTALRLAAVGAVERVLLADADPLVARFWQIAAANSEWLIDRMYEEPVTLERWDYWRSWRPRGEDDRDLAVKCLFLNRTTFSGILHGRAGPIGGRKQESRYTIDCRFNKDALAQRIRFVGELYSKNRIVDVWCKDWQSTLHDVAEWYPDLLPNRVLAYLDPPYLAKSETLYSRSFDPAGGYSAARKGIDTSGWEKGREHYRLAEYLRRKAQYRWILSYDRDDCLLEDPDLYAASRMTPTPADRESIGVRSWYISKRLVDLNYTVAGFGKNGRAAELLFTTLPARCVPLGENMRAV
ncbi:DNA adenine methylase [Streptomyces bicolor]|uniref:DNA adenine methylase n=1 Tax=Streptomyces bicolor TaxID=66874 RepID=UPI0009969C9F